MNLKKAVKKAIYKNSIRKLVKKINQHADVSYMLKGLFYKLIHATFMCLCLLIILFDFSIFHHIVLLNIVSLDAFSVIILHGCPLTLLEKKYIGKSLLDDQDAFLKDLDIVHTCSHDYEKQIELLTNFWCIVAFKILIMMCLKIVIHMS
jgi:hypothetical protein